MARRGEDVYVVGSVKKGTELKRFVLPEEQAERDAMASDLEDDMAGWTSSGS